MEYIKSTLLVDYMIAPGISQNTV